jgi:hypothetical protein
MRYAKTRKGESATILISCDLTRRDQEVKRGRHYMITSVAS